MANTEFIRVRLGPDLKPSWEKVLKERKISQQAAVVALLEWVVKQDPLLQVMLFGQTPEADSGAIAKLILERMTQPKGARSKVK